VYHRTVYGMNAAFSFLEIARPGDPVFVANSFSKAWAMPGWRLGWVVYPEGQKDSFEKLIQFNTSGAPAFLQHAAIVALDQGEDFVREFAARCDAGRQVVNERLGRMKRVRNIPSEGAFYAMFSVDGAKIGMAPGTSFGRGSEHYIRLCYAKAPALLHTAMDRLETFLETYTEA